MTIINLSEFVSYDKYMMAAFLKMGKTGRYEIMIRHEFLPLEGPPLSSCVDYIHAAYAGHLLSLLSQEFSYDVPCRFNDKPFRFIVRTKQYLELANILCGAAKAFFDIKSIDVRFTIAAYKHYDDSENLETYAGAAGLITAARIIDKEYPYDTPKDSK